MRRLGTPVTGNHLGVGVENLQGGGGEKTRP